MVIFMYNKKENIMNWKTTATDGAPKPKTETSGNVTTSQVSDEFLCFDEETNRTFYLKLRFQDLHRNVWFEDHVTKYIRFSDIPKPI